MRIELGASIKYINLFRIPMTLVILVSLDVSDRIWKHRIASCKVIVVPVTDDSFVSLLFWL